MKKYFLLLVMLCVVKSGFAQDSVHVSFSQEMDTLVKQRFIDRYENLFMTKVPTRQMFKLSAIGSEVQGAGFNIAYEYKVSPEFSVEASVYSQLSQFNDGLASMLQHFTFRQVNVWANAKARWYYNMNKRIQEGLNANNFSGAYFGASYEQSVYMPDYVSRKHTARIGLQYGFQSRFFNHGFVDFAVGLYQRDLGQFSDIESTQQFIAPKNFVLGTHFNLGLGLGDWKNTKSTPLCDVLFCDEVVGSHWKVQAPNILLGLQNQVVRTSVAYETAIGKTPLSAQADAGIQYFRYNIYNRTNLTTYSSAEANLSLRYYFLRNYQARHGKGGGNFSGPYAGLTAGYSINGFKYSNIFLPEDQIDAVVHNVTATATLGYQQRLFKKLYIDASLYYLKPISQNASFIVGGYRPFFSSKMSVGFTF